MRRRDKADRELARFWARNSTWGKRRRRRRIIIGCVLAVLILVITLVVTNASTERRDAYIMCRPGSEVNVRDSATTHGQLIGHLILGDSINVDREYKGWVHSKSLSFEQSSGWISADYVVYDYPQAIPEGRTYIVSASGCVAVWKGMTRASRVCWVHPGDKVTVLAISQEWALTDRGYIRTQYLQEQKVGR
ncbi:MAG: hypothetical protein IKE04_05510 [Oscillospiraceae bacterium]|nr:hypothetical protein [Oscillospiraceae bacterium]